MIGILGGVALYKSPEFRSFTTAPIQALRSVPPISTVPFFLMWFGFSEFGKILLVVSGISLNTAIATLQILENIEEKYLIAFQSFGRERSDIPVLYLIPKALESLLPTIRFSLTVAFGVVLVSELLGAQVGLGYLIQSARTI